MAFINKICLGALIVRLVVLIFVVLFSEDLTTGLYSSDITNDDVRYQMGAEIYANQAKQIIDKDAIGDAFLNVGDHSVSTGYAFVLWYWIVSIAMYIFHSHIAVRIINILFAVLSVRFIFDIANKLYGEKIANYSSVLYAFLPYPVFFSCFLYKDQFYTLLLLAIFRIVVQKGANMKLKDFIIVALLIFTSTFIRSGLSVIIAFIVIYLYYRSKGVSLSRTQKILMAPILIISTYYLLNYNMDSIDRKYEVYVLNYGNSSSGVSSFISIKSIDQLYRFPLAYFFVMLLPINTSSSNILSWGALVGSANFVILPIAIGCILYLFDLSNKKSHFYWCIQGLYLITIMSSMGIARHSYYLQPYMMMFFSSFFIGLKYKGLFISCSILFVFLYIVVQYHIF